MKKHLKALIVEDDPLTANRLRDALLSYENIFSEIDIATSYEEARDLLLKAVTPYSISVLDQFLGSKTCYELINDSIIENFGLIVLTSRKPNLDFSRFDVFPKNTPTYISKPYHQKHIQDFIVRLSNRRDDIVADRFIMIKSPIGSLPVKISEDAIVLINSEKGESVFYLKKISSPEKPQTYRVNDPLSTIIEKYGLSKHQFLQVGKSNIINLAHIKTIEEKSNSGNTGTVIMSNDEKAYYSHKYQDIILANLPSKF